MNAVVAVLTLCSIIPLYYFLEKKRNVVLKKTTLIAYSLIVIFSAFLLNPHEEIYLWLIWYVFLYAVLDDWISKSVNILWLVTGFVGIVYYQFDIKVLILSLFVGILFVLFDRKEKKYGRADVIAIVAAVYYLQWMAVSVLVLSIILMYGFVFLKKQKIKEVPYLPFLLVSYLLIKWSLWILVPFLFFYMVVYVIAIIKTLTK